MTKVQEFRILTEEAKFKAFSAMCRKAVDLEKENEQLKAQIEKMKCCWNCKHPAKDSTGCCCPFAASCHNRSLWEPAE